MVMTQPNNDFKVLKKHRVNGHLLTLLLTMAVVRNLFLTADRSTLDNLTADRGGGGLK